MKIEDIYLILFVSILPYIFASDFFKRKIKSRLFSKLLLNCDFFLIFFLQSTGQRTKYEPNQQTTKAANTQVANQTSQNLPQCHAQYYPKHQHTYWLPGIYEPHESHRNPHQFSNSYNKPPAIRVSNMTPFDTHNNSPESICSSTLGNSLSLANCNPSKTPHNSATWEVAISIFLRNPKES